MDHGNTEKATLVALQITSTARSQQTSQVFARSQIQSFSLMEDLLRPPVRLEQLHALLLQETQSHALHFIIWTQRSTGA